MIEPPALKRIEPRLLRPQEQFCEVCGTRAGLSANCPQCRASTFHVEASTSGTILAITEIQDGPLRTDPLIAPFRLALIEFDDGTKRVYPLVASSGSAGIGVRVHLVIRRLYQPECDQAICYGTKARLDHD